MKQLIRMSLTALFLFLQSGYGPCADPDAALADYLAQGRTALERNDTQHALENFQCAYQIAPNDPAVRDALARARIAYAQRLVSEKKYPLAARQMRKVLYAAETDERLRNDLAVLYRDIARAYVKDGATERSFFYYKKACTLMPAAEKTVRTEYADQLFAAAQNEYEHRQYIQAKKHLAAAEAVAPGKEAWYELRGDIAYYEHDSAAARRAWEQAKAKAAAAGSSTEKIDQRLKNLRTEERINADRKVRSTARFTIVVDKGVSRQNVDAIKQLLRNAYAQVSRDLKYYPRNKLPVEIYSAKDFAVVTGPVHRYIGGQYDGKVRIPGTYKRTHPLYFRSLVVHEVTHGFVHDMSGTTCPRWLNEGIAEYEQRKIYRESLGALRRALKRGDQLSQAELEAWKVSLSDRALTNLYYDQAYSLTRYLIKRYRFFKIVQVLKDCGAGIPFDDAVSKRFHKGMDVLYREWLSAVR